MCVARVRLAASSRSGRAAASPATKAAAGAPRRAACSIPVDRSSPKIRPRVPAAIQLGQVATIATADVSGRLVAAKGGQIKHDRGQVDLRMLVGVDGLARPDWHRCGYWTCWRQDQYRQQPRTITVHHHQPQCPALPKHRREPHRSGGVTMSHINRSRADCCACAWHVPGLSAWSREGA
jgi:hypothetical protein